MVHETTGASAEAIQWHYDASESFWECVLGPSMTYSAARFAGPEATLEQAQAAKLEHHLSAAGLSHGGRLLDVGCGFGTLLATAGRLFDEVSGIGLTLSAVQHAYAQRVCEGVAQVRLQPWETFTADTPFDAVISVGAFEHFARPEMDAEQRVATYQAFFHKCREWLRPGGRLSLQTITYGPRWNEAWGFATDRFFPESALPYPSEILAASQGVLHFVSAENRPHDYERTSQEWLQRIEQNKAALVGANGIDTVERYRQCFRSGVLGFRHGVHGLTRWVFQRG